MALIAELKKTGTDTGTGNAAAGKAAGLAAADKTKAGVTTSAGSQNKANTSTAVADIGTKTSSPVSDNPEASGGDKNYGSLSSPNAQTDKASTEAYLTAANKSTAVTDTGTGGTSVGTTSSGGATSGGVTKKTTKKKTTTTATAVTDTGTGGSSNPISDNPEAGGDLKNYGVLNTPNGKVYSDNPEAGGDLKNYGVLSTPNAVPDTYDKGQTESYLASANGTVQPASQTPSGGAKPSGGTAPSGTTETATATTPIQELDLAFTTPTTQQVTGGVEYPSSQVEQFLSTLGDYESETQKLIDERYAVLQKAAEDATDYATKIAVDDLKQTLEEYEQKYAEERQKLAYTSAQASDNLALQNSAKGINGGIAGKLYSDQQAQYDSQLYSINLEELNFSADIEKQINDAIAQGEYEKAKMIAEYGVAKMEEYAALRSEIMNYKYSGAGAIDTFNQNKANFDEGVREFNLQQQATELNNFLALLEMGLFDAEAATALGIDPEWAEAYAARVNTLAQLDLDTAKAELANAYKKGSSASSDAVDITQFTTGSTLYSYLVGTLGWSDSEAMSYLGQLEQEGKYDGNTGIIDWNGTRVSGISTNGNTDGKSGSALVTSPYSGEIQTPGNFWSNLLTPGISTTK